MDKRRYFLRKILHAALTIVLVTSFNFVLFRILPGDPARLLLPQGRFAATAIAKQRKAFDLNKPLGEQFIYYWRDCLEGRFGDSYVQKRPVTQVVGQAIVPTLVLVGVGTLLATVVGMTAGIFAGWRRNSKFDVTVTNLGMIMWSMPTFWVAMLFVSFFSVRLGWFPTGRMTQAGAIYSSFFDRAAAFADHLFLPAFVLSITWAGSYQLIMRSSVISVMKEDFALTARAKGLSDNAVLWRHVVRNALLPTMTLVMMNFGFVLSGAILIETVFNWPGLGLLAYDSMLSRDYPVMQLVFLIASVAVIVANLLADILYYYLDPRVRA